MKCEQSGQKHLTEAVADIPDGGKQCDIVLFAIFFGPNKIGSAVLLSMTSL